MTEPPADRPPQTRQPLWRRALKWTVRIVIVLVVLGVAAYAIGNYWAAKSIRDQVAAIRAAGQPVTFADLDALAPKVAPAQDSGPYYAAALALVRDVEEPWLPAYDQAITSGQATPAVLDEAQRRVDNNRLALDMLDRGSKLSGCNYDMELRYGIAVVLHRLGTSRTLAKAASLRTRLLALQGRGDEAAESVISSLGMLRMFDRQPILIAALVKIVCAGLFCDDVKAILDHGHLSAQSLQALESALSRVEQSMDMRSMFLAERVYYLEVTRNIVGGSRELQSANVSETNYPQLPGAPPSSVPLRIIVAQSLPVYGRFIEAAARGWPGMLDAAKVIDAVRLRMDFFGRLVAPAFTRSVTTAARLEAQLRSAIVAARIERYRLATGRLPDSLQQLPDAQTLPADPFTGGPLIYRKTADGYCVYGLDEDRRDAGGENLNQRGPNWGIAVQVAATQPAP